MILACWLCLLGHKSREEREEEERLAQAQVNGQNGST